MGSLFMLVALDEELAFNITVLVSYLEMLICFVERMHTQSKKEDSQKIKSSTRHRIPLKLQFFLQYLFISALSFCLDEKLYLWQNGKNPINTCVIFESNYFGKQINLNLKVEIRIQILIRI